MADRTRPSRDDPQRLGRPEILAPAGGPASWAAALAAGADAVYCGLDRFSARTLAENFTLAELGGLIAESRRRGVKAYLAMNSLVKEGELAQAFRMMMAAAELGPDALIVADPGLAYLARRHAPQIPLHASTLMAVHTHDGLMVLKALGFARAVLPRELNLGEIGDLCARRPVELEVFVHGALCFCFSGLCLMSSFLGGRSALRGGCTQPCRRVYQNAGRQRAFFSLADLSAAPLVLELRRLPVAALKIEGRMKGPDHVGQVVAAYRALVDADESGFGEAIEKAREILARAPGRPASESGFLTGEPYSHELWERQVVSGVRLGELAPHGPGLGFIRLEAPLRLGDRLRLVPAHGEAGEPFKLRGMWLVDPPEAAAGAAAGPAAEAAPGSAAGADDDSSVDPPPDPASEPDPARPRKAPGRAGARRGTATVKTAPKTAPKSAVKPAAKSATEAAPKAAPEAEPKADHKTVSEAEPKVPARQGRDRPGASADRNPSDPPGGRPQEPGCPAEAAEAGQAVVVLLGESTGPSGELYLTGSSTLEKSLLASDPVKRLKAAAKALRPDPDSIALPAALTVKGLHGSLAGRSNPLWFWLDGVADLDEIQKFRPARVIMPLAADTIKELSRQRKRYGRLSEFVWSLPPLLMGRSQEKARREAGKLIEAGAREFMVSNLGQIAMLDRLKTGLKLWGDHRLGILNHQAGQVLAGLGLAGVTVSAEADQETFELLAKTDPGGGVLMYLYGRPPLFTARFRPPGLRRGPVVSRRGEKFWQAEEGEAFILQSERRVFVGGLLKVPKPRGFAGLLVDLRREPNLLEAARRVKKAIDQGLSGPGLAFNFKRGLT